MGNIVNRRSAVAILSGVLCWSPAVHAAHYALIVAGLGGEAEYERRFREEVDSLEGIANRFGSEAHVTALRGEQATREAVRRAMATIAERATAADQLVVTFIGHGSFDGENYRFNVPGSDITDADMAAWLQPIAARQQLIVLATSASGAAVTRLQRDHRIVVTATKNGAERNAIRFAEHWVKALTSLEADRDKNDWVTVQEAYDYAARKVADTFKDNAALATEHSRMEGAKAEQFALGRLGNAKAMPTDAELNRLFAERLRIEADFETVKARKTDLKEDDYYVELEKALVELARTQKKIDARQASLSGAER